MFVENAVLYVVNAILYVVIGVLYVAEFKFTGPNSWNFTVHPFLESVPRPQGTFMAKNAPKMPILLKKTFLAHNFDWFA